MTSVQKYAAAAHGCTITLQPLTTVQKYAGAAHRCTITLTAREALATAS